MTHEELLARIAKLSITPETNVVPSELATALMTVVKLHKPRVHIAGCCKDTDSPMDCSESYIACEGCNLYPCATIQAIEKELA
jgi:hypothetical protein